MSRYIEADKVLMALRLDHKDVIYIDKNDTAKRIEKIPSIDIVRCKECRHWCNHKDADYDQSEFTYYCEVHGISLTGNDFCSYGEREGS